MKKQIVLLFMALLSVNISIAGIGGIGGNKFLEGELVLEDGKVRKGYIQVPKTDIAMSISFKESLDAQEEKIKTLTISSFIVYSDNGQNTFECVFADLSQNPSKQRIAKYKVTMLVLKKGYATLYIKGSKFKTNKDGTIDIVSYALESEGGTPRFFYYLKKQDMDYAAPFDITYTQSKSFVIDFNKNLIRNAETYLSENPELVERVKNGDFTHKNIPELIEIYNKHMVNTK